MNKYEVKCKCGHVGRNKYIVISFPVLAENGKDAARKARNFPRVKHHNKEAIISVKKITEEEYEQLQNKNAKDGYLKCKNIQDQRKLDISNRVIKEKENAKFILYEEERKHYFLGKTEIKKPKKILKYLLDNNCQRESYVW